MLEHCTDIDSCEKQLSESIANIQLLGEVPLSNNDIEKLARMIRKIITPSLSKGTNFLRTKVPTCFAFFLVGMGRFYDKEIGFWPIVEENVGAIDINWKTKWGKFFLQFLEQHDLPQFNEEEGLAYVTPILGHVCIPDRCLDEYFDRVMIPLVNRELLNPLDAEEIIHDLRTRRTINNRRLALERKKKEQVENLDELLNAQRSLIRRRDIYQAVSALIADEAECERKRIALRGLEDAESTRINYIDQIKAAAEAVRGLETDGKRIWTEIKALQKQYQPILDHKDQIVEIIQTHQKLAMTILEAKVKEETLFAQVTAHWAALSSRPWEDHYGAAIIELMIDQIRAQIEQVLALEEQLKKIRERIEILRASQKTVRKTPPPLLVPLILVWRLFFRTGRKTKKSPSGELQDLCAALEKTKADQQQKRAAIQAALSQLPIDARQLETPKIGLHQQIVTIRQTYTQALEARETRSQLEREVEGVIKRSLELGTSLGIAHEDQTGSWIDRLTAALVEVVQGQEHARKAHQILEEDIRPALEAARAEHQHLQGKLESLDQQLANIGEGSVNQGLSRVREFHQYQEATVRTRQNLNSRYVDFASLERELRDEGLDTIQARLEESAAKIEDQGKDIGRELERVEQDLSHYPAQYFGIDEPIRRFLLYGGSTSERMLRSSVFLFALAKAGERKADISEPELPDRLIQRFQQWWEYYQARSGGRSNASEETNPATGERFRAPQIAFDRAADEVITALPAQRILRPERSATVELETFGDDLNEPIHSARLKLYGRSEGLVETQPCEEIVLTAPSEKYVFRLTCNDQLIREWAIPGVSAQAPYLAFSGTTNRQIKGDTLPQAHIIFVIKENLTIHPGNCILTTGDHLHGDWSEYVWYELNLTTCEGICLSEESGQSLSISLTSDPGAGITLEGGQQSLNVVSNEQAVYTAPPECVRIPIADQSDLHLLRFSIIAEDENRFLLSKHYQLNELAGTFESNNEGWLEIPLNHEQLLGENPFGRFTLRVYKPPYLDWQTTFCVVPGLGLSFDQEVYPPYHERIPNVRALLTIPERSTFQPDQPAVVLSNDETIWQVQAPATKDQITGILTNPHIGKEAITLSLTLIIPKIRWRLMGLDGIDHDQWLDHVKEELWLGDWTEAQELFLIVELPDILIREAVLVLPGNSVTVPCGRMFEHKVRFDLKALEDKLRAGPPLETISISLCNNTTRIISVPLFTVRTRWLAEITKCHYQPEGDTARVDVSWKEWGKANQIAARLWYLSSSQPKLIQEQIVPGRQETTFRSPLQEVTSGKYLVHLEPYDPWSSRAVCPNSHGPNTKIVEIITKSPEKAVTLRTVMVDLKHSYPLRDGSYKIHIIGKVTNQHLPDDAKLENIGHILVTPSNENWYVGNFWK